MKQRISLDISIRWDSHYTPENVDANASWQRDEYSVCVELETSKKMGELVERCYKGKLSTSQSAEDFAGHIVSLSELAPKRTDLYKSDDGVMQSRICRWDEGGQGYKSVKIKGNGQSDRLSELRCCLNNLKRRHKIISRAEDVNDCDYWDGFLGTSNNMWGGSVYSKASPYETALQFAYELEKGIRKVEGWSIWHFPGYIGLDEERLNPQQIELIKSINVVLSENGKLEKGKEFVSEKLREFARKYLAATL